jgi:phosphoglycolate phosphatase/beta-phosphoglucomutase
MIRAVIFDFNGILADDDPIHMQALRQVAEEEGLTFSEDEYMERYLPLNDRDCFNSLWQKNKRTPPGRELENLIQRKSVYYFRAIEQKDVLFPDAAKAVRAAAARGPVAIASGARIGEIRQILARGRLLECFSVIVAAEDVQQGKPDPEPFRLACERLKQYRKDLVPRDCVAVEDSFGGIQSARSAGIRCLAVAHSYPRKRLEEAMAEWTIDSISDFAEWLERV